MGGGETDGDGEGGEALEPCPRCLLQAVEGLDELAHVITMESVDEAFRLVAVDLDAVEEGIFNVQLMDRLVAGGCQGEHHADRRRFDDGRKSFPVVDAGALGEATNDPASLVPLQRAILA